MEKPNVHGEENCTENFETLVEKLNEFLDQGNTEAATQQLTNCIKARRTDQVQNRDKGRIEVDASHRAIFFALDEIRNIINNNKGLSGIAVSYEKKFEGKHLWIITIPGQSNIFIHGAERVAENPIPRGMIERDRGRSRVARRMAHVNPIASRPVFSFSIKRRGGRKTMRKRRLVRKTRTKKLS